MPIFICSVHSSTPTPAAMRPPDDLLARVLSGEGTIADRAIVDRWAASSPAAAAELARLHSAWGDATPPSQSWDVDRAWSKVADQLDAAEDAPAVVPVPDVAPSRSRPTPWLAIAAAVVLLAGLTWVWPQLRGVAGPSVVHVTVEGERKTVELVDGSTVVLGPRSALTVSARYGDDDRELLLTGQGWFDVAPGDAHPFTVVAGSYTVRDIGTVFTVQTTSGDTVGVSVIEGEVAVRRNTDGAPESRLTAGDVGRFTAGSVPVLVERGQPTAALGSWAEGDLALVDVAAGDALAALARWYDATITLDDPSLAARPVTITLTLDSLDRALDDLALLLGVTVQREPGGFVLR